MYKIKQRLMLFVEILVVGLLIWFAFNSYVLKSLTLTNPVNMHYTFGVLSDVPRSICISSRDALQQFQ